MNNNNRLGILKRPIMTGAAAIALAIAAFGAGSVLSPQALTAQAIPAQAPAAASSLPGFADIVERVAPAVVAIEVKGKPKPNGIDARDLESLPPELRRFFEGRTQPKTRAQPTRSGGSGFFISANGHIVTNNHVIDEADEIKVTLKDGRELTAKVIGTDERTDLAVIKVEGTGYRFVQFEPESNIRVGDWVVAIGNPFGLGGTATAGIVSALGRENIGDSNIADFIQIDAPINSGNSGGPTFDMRGRVIGVNTAIFSRTGGNIGIGFAIPAPIANRVTNQIINAGKVTYGWLGVSIQDLSTEMADSFGLGSVKGALIGSVTDGAPAAKAGMRRGDVILKMNGQDILGASDLTRRIGQTTVGQTVRLDVANAEGRKRVVNVVIAARPSEQQLAQNGEPVDATTPVPAANATPTALGITLGQLTPAARTKLKLAPNDKGMLITAIDEESEAAVRGLRVGDAILEVNGQDLTSASQFSTAVNSAKSANRTSVGLYVQSAEFGRGTYLPLPVK